MITFLKILFKATIIASAAVVLLYVCFVGSIHAYLFFGSNLAGASWMFGVLVAIFSFMIAMSQENRFSQRVIQIGKAFWAW